MTRPTKLSTAAWLLPFLLLAAPVAPLLAAAPAASPESGPRWVGTWGCAPQLTEERNLPPPPGLGDTTLRQVVQVSIGGPRIRVRFSNAFGDDVLHLTSAHLAVATAVGESRIRPETDRPITFDGKPGIDIPQGAFVISDPIDFALKPLMDLAITLHVRNAPHDVTGHPGSRTTSFLQAGDAVTAAELPDAARTDHWYFLTGIDVWASSPGVIVTLGDSITDGRGSTTNGNDRWPDQLMRQLQADAQTAGIGVLNQGIGGNRLLRDGLGPNALARLDRDVIAQAGVRWLIVFEGINDLGSAVRARAHGEPAITARDIISGYRQIITRAHAHGIRVYGGTLLACEGSQYEDAQLEADRQKINRWIRTSGDFDAVIDFDAATRDPDHPSRLAPAVDVGDHLHLNPHGYRVMAEAIDLGLFAN